MCGKFNMNIYLKKKVLYTIRVRDFPLSYYRHFVHILLKKTEIKDKNNQTNIINIRHHVVNSRCNFVNISFLHTSLTHFILNELFCHMYWKTPFSI